MRNRELHDALRAFALEAAALLHDDQDAGAEVEFDLEEGKRRGRGGPSLYHYRPLTSKFVADRWRRLSMLPTCRGAAQALGAGAESYLRVNGLRGAEAEPALRAMLERLYEDATDFAFPEERFERVYAEVERTLYQRSRPATVLAAIHGLELAVDRVDLGHGVELVRGGYTDAPAEALWGDVGGTSAETRREPNVLLTLTCEIDPGDAPLLEEAYTRFALVVTGLRLWKPGGVALSSVGWRRSGDGAWTPFEIEGSGLPRGVEWTLREGEDAKLREFLPVIARARPSASVAWALARFEMGCGRRRDSEALSDYLLALRALVDPSAESGEILARRVAVLCAEESERELVQRHVELALALERFVMGDTPGDDYMDALGSGSPRELIDEVERHLRALLRDVLCGYLDSDLRAVSDELLRAQQPPPAQEPAQPEPVVQSQPVAQPQPTPQPIPVPTAQAEPQLPLGGAGAPDEGVTTEIAAIEAAGGEFGVTATGPGEPVHDWDDPASFSAPV